MIDWLIDCFIDWLPDWLIDCLIDWFIAWLIDWLPNWLIDWLPYWLIYCLIDWLIALLIDSLINWLPDWLIAWLTDWLPDLLHDWLIDWVNDRMMHTANAFNQTILSLLIILRTENVIVMLHRGQSFAEQHWFDPSVYVAIIHKFLQRKRKLNLTKLKSFKYCKFYKCRRFLCIT